MALKKALQKRDPARKRAQSTTCWSELSDDEEEEPETGKKASANYGLEFPDTEAANFIIQWDKTGASTKGASKSKGKHVKPGTHANLVLDYHDVTELTDIETYWQDLQTIIDHQRKFFVHHLSVR